MVRDGEGRAHALSATGATEEEARTALDSKARLIWTGLLSPLSERSTVAEVAEIWLEEGNPDTPWGAATRRNYASTLRNHVLPRIGALRIVDLSAGLAKRVVNQVEAAHTRSTARMVHLVLMGIAGTAELHEVTRGNPVRAVKRPRRSKAKTVAYSPDQIAGIVHLVRGWQGANPGRKGGGRPDIQLLEDVVLVMAGTSMRVSEALGLRREDVYTSPQGWVVSINGTIAEGEPGEGLQRKDTPKAERQTRSVIAPSYLVAVLRRQLANYRDNPAGLLFPTRTGAPRSHRGVAESLRAFRAQNRASLLALGVEPTTFSSKRFRSSVATVVAGEGGIALSQDLLGHENVRTTNEHYVEPQLLVDPRTATILDSTIGAALQRLDSLESSEIDQPNSISTDNRDQSRAP